MLLNRNCSSAVIDIKMSLKGYEVHEIAEACFELKKESGVKKNKFALAGSG